MSKTPSRALLAFALASAFAVPSFSAHAADAAAPAAAAASAPTVRAELGKLLNQAQDAVRAGKFADAAELIKQARALAGLTPYEAYVITRLNAQAAYGNGDVATTIRDFEATLASEFMPAAERRTIQEALIKIVYNAKQYPKAAKLIATWKAEGGKDPLLLSLLGQAYYLSEDWPAALVELQAQANAEKAANGKPSEKLLRMIASAQSGNKDDAGYGNTVFQLARYYPTAEYWQDVVARNTDPDLVAKRLDLDMLRLRQAILGVKDGNAAVTHAYLAQKAGYPAEAKALLEPALAAKLVSTATLKEATDALRTANRTLDADHAQAAANEASARQAKTGDGLVSLGLELVLDGQADKGLAMIEAGFTKGGLKNADDARLHQAYALYRAGRLPEAAKAFEQVQGKDGARLLADTWAAWIAIGGKLPG